MNIINRLISLKQLLCLMKTSGMNMWRAIPFTCFREWFSRTYLFTLKDDLNMIRSRYFVILNLGIVLQSSVQFSSVAQSCPTLCHPMNCSTPGLPVHHQLPESTQTHVHRVGDAIQPSHPLSSPSPPALSLSQHQGLFKWVSSLHQVAKVLEFQLQQQSLQWTPRTDLL